MFRFDRIVVIFNPGSTGDAPTPAERLRSDADVPVVASPTRPAGHARGGELLELGPGTPVRIDSAPRALATVGRVGR